MQTEAVIKVLKAGPGLDPDNAIQKVLGARYQVIDHDPDRALEDQVGEATVLLLRDRAITASVIDAAPRLKLLQRYGQHVVGVDFEHAARRGIPVANIPTEVTRADRIVAEHALHLMMAVAKQEHVAQRNVVTGILGAPKTRSLSGKTLALVGLGNTGKELTKLVRGFDMRVIAVKRTLDDALARSLGIAFLGTFEALSDVLGQADFVSIHLPLDPSTRGFVGAPQFSAMKFGAILINIARGPIVNEAAMISALRSGRLGGAGLDVVDEEPIDPKSPLLGFDNVVVTPHIAGVTDEIAERASAVVLVNIERVLSGKAPLYQITRPV